MTPYTKAKTLRPPSAAWKEMVAARLREGYGVEDIALWLDCPVSVIRLQVQLWREDGTLAKWWPKASEATQ